MTASIRTVRSISYSDTAGHPTISTSGVQAGDTVTIVHSADAGSLSQMTISGGGWQLLDSAVSEDFFGGGGGTKIWRKVAGSSEPSSYQLSHASGGAHSIVALVAVRDADPNSIVIDIDGSSAFFPLFKLESIDTPALAPPSGSGLELRIAVAFSGFGDLGATTHWSTPGSAQITTNQSSDFLAMVVAQRQLVSSAPVDSIDYSNDQSYTGGHGITIIIPAGESTTPTPPDVPSFTPAAGTSTWRYTVHDFLTGTYLADIQPTGVYFDVRLNEPGTFSATLPVPSRRIAEQVQKVIPATSSELQAGPGRIVVLCWRIGRLWGEYWLTSAEPQFEDGRVSLPLHGSSVEAYLLHVTVDEDLSFSGDQIANIRDLFNHLMSDPDADIGLDLQGGTSGVIRPLTTVTDDNATYGDTAWGYTKAAGGFEWTVRPTVVDGQVVRKWVWGYPKITSSVVHTFTQSPTGGDIEKWGEQIDALRGGTRVRVRGGTPEATDATEGSEPVQSAWTSATAHLAAGWPRIDQAVDHPSQSIVSGELNDFATRWISVFKGAVRIYTCSVILGKNPTISTSSLGDQVRRMMVNVWYPRKDTGAAGFDMTQRLIGIGVRPAARDSGGKDRAELVLEEPGL